MPGDKVTAEPELAFFRAWVALRDLREPLCSAKRSSERVREVVRMCFARFPVVPAPLAYLTRLCTRRHRCDRVLVMQPAQHRFGEHERTRRQSMSGFRLRDSTQIPAEGPGTPGPNALCGRPLL